MPRRKKPNSARAEPTHPDLAGPPELVYADLLDPTFNWGWAPDFFWHSSQQRMTPAPDNLSAEWVEEKFRADEKCICGEGPSHLRVAFDYWGWYPRLWENLTHPEDSPCPEERRLGLRCYLKAIHELAIERLAEWVERFADSTNVHRAGLLCRVECERLNLFGLWPGCYFGDSWHAPGALPESVEIARSAQVLLSRLSARYRNDRGPAAKHNGAIPARSPAGSPPSLDATAASRVPMKYAVTQSQIANVLKITTKTLRGRIHEEWKDFPLPFETGRKGTAFRYDWRVVREFVSKKHPGIWFPENLKLPE